jgi:hypothetical protein
MEFSGSEISDTAFEKRQGGDVNQSGMRGDRRLSPKDPPSLAERIRLVMDSFTPSEKRAAHLLLSHYPFAGLDTVAEFATRAGISAPSVLRFVTRLGFSGFPDFQKHLRGELEAQLLSPLAKAGPSDKGQGAPALSSFAEAVIGNLRATVENIPIRAGTSISPAAASPVRSRAMRKAISASCAATWTSWKASPPSGATG